MPKGEGQSNDENICASVLSDDPHILTTVRKCVLCRGILPCVVSTPGMKTCQIQEL